MYSEFVADLLKMIAHHIATKSDGYEITETDD